MADFLKGWERKQNAYKKLPRIVRFPLLGLAFMLLPAGVMAMFTPLAVLEVGSILIFTSLTILSFEFGWAYSVLRLLSRKLQNKGFRRKMTVFVMIVLAMYVTLIFVRLRQK